MSKASEAANGLMVAVAQVCGLYGVPQMRIQSRTFNVVGAGGKVRPMFVGEWTDDQGEKHRKGMADFLLMPRIRLNLDAQLVPRQPLPANLFAAIHASAVFVAVPLWVEAKMASGRLEPDQRAFKAHVEACGAYYLELHDSADELIAWFEKHGVTRP